MIAHVMDLGAAGMQPRVLPMLALDVAIKGIVLLASAGVLSVLLRRRSAAVRHLVWTIAVTGVLLLPLLAGLLPRIPLPVLAREASVKDVAPQVALLAEQPLPVIAEQAVAPRYVATPEPRVEAEAIREYPIDDVEATPANVFPIWRVLLLVWAVGMLVVLFRMVLEYTRVARFTARAKPVMDVALLTRVQRYSRESGLSVPPEVIEGDAFAMPVTWGVFRPVLLLPSGAAAWPAQRLRAVVLHELAHVKRCDALTQLVAQLVCAMHWFNPLAWIAAKRLYVEREHACDDIVLSAGERPSDYAEELLDLVRVLRPARATALAAIAMARPSQLRERLTAVLDDGRNRTEASIGLAFKFAVAGAAILIPLSALQPVRRADALEVPHHELFMPEVMAGPEEVLAPAAIPIPTLQPLPAPPIPPTPPVPTIQSPEAVLPMATLSPLPPAAEPGIRGFTGGLNRGTQERCGTGSRNTSISSNNDDDRKRYTLTWRIGRCSGVVRIDGDVKFNGDFSGVASITSGGELLIEQDDGDNDHRLIVRPGGQALTYNYQLNRRNTAFDANARAWFRDMLEMLFRTTGFAADDRVDYLLQTSGPTGVLAEVSEMNSDHVQRLYLQKLLERENLSSALVKSSLDIAGRELGSDYERAQLLISAANHYELDGSTRAAYLDAAGSIRSDYERRRVLDHLLKKSSLTATDVASILRSASTIRSDYEKAQLLVGLTRNNLEDPALQRAFLEAAASISSDYEHRRTLMALLNKGPLSQGGLDVLLADAPNLKSDYELAQLLVHIAEKHQLNDKQREAFRKAMDSISSQYEYGRVATALVKHQR